MTDTNIFLQKYNPNSLNEMIGQENIINILKGYISNNNIPHLLFTGSPGIGKTTAAVIIAKELFGDDWQNNTIMMNASDERGIDIIRNKIKTATKIAPIRTKFKIIFMDEADFLTEPAQRALRDIVVKNQNITRFIFSVNDLSKIIDPVQDRCQIFRFKPLKFEDINRHLIKIVNNENIEISFTHIDLIAKLANGSMRKAVNALQSVYTQTEISESIIRELMNSTLNNSNIDKLLDLIKTGNVEVYEKYLFELIYNGGYDPNEIMDSIIDNLIKLNRGNIIPIIVGMAEYQWRMSQGANPLLQLRCGLLKLSQTKI